MPIPPESILRAAVRWLERIPTSGVARTRSLLVTNPRLADLTPTQYEMALDWIRRTGLASKPQMPWKSPAETVYEAAVTEAVWFRDLDVLISSPDDLPADAAAAAAAIGLSENDGFRLATTKWAQVDTEQRERVGAMGEAQLIELLRSSVVGTVEQVSKWTDNAGFDVLVRVSGANWHLEVKTSTRQQRTTFYLSRNEYEVMRADPQWALVHLALDREDQVVRIRTIDSRFIREAAPADTGAYGRWQSCSVDVPPEAQRVGIPQLQSALRRDASPLLWSRSA